MAEHCPIVMQQYAIGGDAISWSRGCMRKNGHDGEHLDISELGEITAWEGDPNCGCPYEEECHCTLYRYITMEELLATLSEDHGNNLPSDVQEMLENLRIGKEHKW